MLQHTVCTRFHNRQRGALLRKAGIFLAVLALTNGMRGSASEERAGAPDGKVLFEKTCSQCHPAKDAWRGSGTRASWQGVVTRMQQHAKGTDKAFDDTVAAQILDYLTGERAAGQEEAAPGAAVAPPGRSDAEAAEHTEHEETTAAIVGASLGVATGVLALLSIASGLLRRRLKRRFRPIHVTLAVLIAAALAGHGGVMFLQVGSARSLWHGAGVLGGAVLVGVMLVGILRRRLKRRFLPVHKSLAAVAIILILLHRVLA